MPKYQPRVSPDEPVVIFFLISTIIEGDVKPFYTRSSRLGCFTRNTYGMAGVPSLGSHPGWVYPRTHIDIRWSKCQKLPCLMVLHVRYASLKIHTLYDQKTNDDDANVRNAGTGGQPWRYIWPITTVCWRSLKPLKNFLI